MTSTTNTPTPKPDGDFVDMREAALQAARAGYHVFPCHEPIFDDAGACVGCTCEDWRRSEECKRKRPQLYLGPDGHCATPGKCPRVNWRRESTRLESAIRKWWNRWPTANIAADCGKSGVLGVDEDSYKDAALGQKLPPLNEETRRALTGNLGTHLHYAQPHGVAYGNAKGLLPAGVDIKGDGGYLMLPPSLHASGRRYAWELDHGPDEIALAPIPDELRQILENAQRQAVAVSFSDVAVKPPDLDRLRLPADVINLIHHPKPKGQRSEADLRVVKELCRAGATDDEIRAIFSTFPIGAQGKFAEEGDVYLARTIGKARAYHAQKRAERMAKLGLDGIVPPAAPPTHPPQPDASAAATGHTPSANAVQSDQALAQEPLPTIAVNNRQLRWVLQDAQEALKRHNSRRPSDPTIYVRSGHLARVTKDGIVSLGVDGLTRVFADAADWVSVRNTKTGQETVHVYPPQAVAATFLGSGEWPELPELEGVIRAPAFVKGWQLHSAAGYDSRTRLYQAGDVCLGDTEPTAERLNWAKRLILDDLLGDFPFKDTASRAHAVALFLLGFVRYAIGGATPLHMIDAPTQGTGKGLLARVCSLPATGTPVSSLSIADSEEETRKKITAVLKSGRTHVLLDNLVGQLSSQSLATALTEPIWEDREMRTFASLQLPISVVWVATANNVQPKEDFPRRIVWIRMDANCENPQLRTGFRHPNLAEWAQVHRAELVTAGIVLVRNWLEQGARPGNYVKGSYELWAQVMGGILDAAGIPGFLANEGELLKATAVETGMWTAFVEEWAKRHNMQPVTAGDLYAIASHYDGQADPVQQGLGLLDDLLGAGNERSRQIRLGKTLGTMVDRVIAGRKLVRGKRVNGHQQWRLEVVEGHPPIDYTGPAIWANADHDEPVTITGHAGDYGGIPYFSTSEGRGALPGNELRVVPGGMFGESGGMFGAQNGHIPPNIPPAPPERNGGLVECGGMFSAVHIHTRTHTPNDADSPDFGSRGGELPKTFHHIPPTRGGDSETFHQNGPNIPPNIPPNGHNIPPTSHAEILSRRGQRMGLGECTALEESARQVGLTPKSRPVDGGWVFDVVGV